MAVERQPLSETRGRAGPLVHVTLDHPIRKCLSTYARGTQQEIDILVSFLKEGDTFLDISTNMSEFNSDNAKDMGQSGQGLVFEEQPKIVDLLRWNIGETNLACRFRAINGRVSGKIGTTPFLVPNYLQNTILSAAASIEELFTEETIQEALKKLSTWSITRCDLIRMDANGFEIKLLEGIFSILQNLYPIVYAKCNDFKSEENLISYLKKYGYRVFCRRIDSFKYNNSLGESNGSSLLFVTSERASDAELSINHLGLGEIFDIQGYVGNFSETLRYGEQLKKPTTKQIELALESSAESGEPKIDRPIAVIIPVFNALHEFKSLVSSIESAFPDVIGGLMFLFSDDSSTDPGVARFFDNSFFFQRKDVLIIKHDSNLGFIKNVNFAFNLIANALPKADFVILNSDTCIFPNLFQILQQQAYSEKGIASVTPLTNNGTIASILHWPNGSELPAGFSSAALANSVTTLGLGLHDNIIPTGIGFCMYIVRKAFDCVGLFDEVFGSGYGEECDWCRRAAQLGFKNILAPQAFVYHSGGRSFGNALKTAKMAKNQKILLSKHSNYDDLVSKYIQKDPLKFHRVLIILHSIKNYVRPRAVHLFTLHSDPDSIFYGGTEKHVRRITSLLLQDRHAVLIIAPKENETFLIRGMLGEDVFLEEFFHQSLIEDLMSLIESYVDSLHVHHTMFWSQASQTALAKSSIPNKIVTVHDFWFICPTINLLTGKNRDQFCQLEPDPSKCNLCLGNYYNYPEQIQSYRNSSLNFLEHFDKILVPSQSVAGYFQTFFRREGSALDERIQVLGHDLSYIIDVTEQGLNKSIQTELDKSVIPKKVIFIGALGMHKGSVAIIDAIPLLNAEGIEVEIIGRFHSAQHPNLRLGQVTVLPYKGVEDLKGILQLKRPDVLAFPSIWPETFCYVFYEGLILCPSAVPVVGPYGNPAEVALKESLGPVMKETTGMALFEAVKKALANQTRYQDNVRQFVAKLKTRDQSYLTCYLETAFQLKSKPRDHVNFIPTPKTLNYWSQISSIALERSVVAQKYSALAQERNTFAIKAAIKIQNFFRRNPRLKKLVLAFLRPTWKTLKLVKSKINKLSTQLVRHGRLN